MAQRTVSPTPLSQITAGASPPSVSTLPYISTSASTAAAPDSSTAGAPPPQILTNARAPAGATLADQSKVALRR